MKLPRSFVSNCNIIFHSFRIWTSRLIRRTPSAYVRSTKYRYMQYILVYTVGIRITSPEVLTYFELYRTGPGFSYRSSMKIQKIRQLSWYWYVLELLMYVCIYSMAFTYLRTVCILYSSSTYRKKRMYSTYYVGTFSFGRYSILYPTPSQYSGYCVFNGHLGFGLKIFPIK